MRWKPSLSMGAVVLACLTGLPGCNRIDHGGGNAVPGKSSLTESAARMALTVDSQSAAVVLTFDGPLASTARLS